MFNKKKKGFKIAPRVLRLRAPTSGSIFDAALAAPEPHNISTWIFDFFLIILF
jgi:hypothetical protein